MKCSQCGTENRSGARFCQKCGAALDLAPKTNPSRQPTKPLPSSPPRGGNADAPTRPLPGPVTFAPLPEGALLKNEKYVVLEIRATSERTNEYLVEDTQPVRLCPQCRAETPSPEERFCTSCGADISTVAPVFLRYRLRESADEQAFGVLAALLQSGMDHAGLFLPREVFTEAPYGPPRAYSVEYEQAPIPAASIPVPQEIPQVLEWGILLARALEQLHRKGFTVGEADLRRIGIEGRRAAWLYLETARSLSPQAVSYTHL
ncbi:MAG: zinc ribbon domain-containing protein, partial [Anaerolineae bacterium]|nr:zinc ribbon domain-containing protein [Anaerolineae bacterium]